MQVQDFYYFLVLHYNMAFTSKCQLLELFNYAEQFSFSTAIAGCAYDRVRRSGVAIKNSNCDSFGNKKKHLSCSFIASTLSLNAWQLSTILYFLWLSSFKQLFAASDNFLYWESVEISDFGRIRKKRRQKSIRIQSFVEKNCVSAQKL